MLIMGLNSCMYYFKTRKVEVTDRESSQRVRQGGKYIIVHQGDSALNLTSCIEDDSSLYGTLNPVSEDHMKYLTTSPNPPKGNRYRKNAGHNESALLDEIHIYLKPGTLTDFSCWKSVSIPYTSIVNVELYVKDRARTNLSWLVPGIGGGLIGGSIVIVTAVGLYQLSHMHLNIGL